MSDFAKTHLTCNAIDEEIADTQAFIDQVNKKSEFSKDDAAAILGDLGIGNAREKNAALESAARRMAELKALQDTKNCGAQAAKSRQ